MHTVLRTIGHQKWLRGRDRILRAFSHPDTQKSSPFEIQSYGVRYTGNLNNFIDWTVFYYGAYQAHELALLRALASAIRAQEKPVNFFDVGANIGYHTLFMSKYADHVFAFEPFDVVMKEMHRKLRHANLSNVTTFPVALGDRDEVGSFHPPTGANQGTGTLGAILPDNASSETISVQVASGDNLLAAQNLPPISLLKMDVEGYEMKVLQGLKRTLWRDRPPILVEISRETLKHSRKAEHLAELLYPDSLLYNVGANRSGNFLLRPFARALTDEVLILPAELAGSIPGAQNR